MLGTERIEKKTRKKFARTTESTVESGGKKMGTIMKIIQKKDIH